MLEVADIFRLHGPQYREKFADRMLPSHRRAMQDIEQCRTAALGGQLYYCAQCQEQRYSYHSCQNRHCPKCGNEQANEWLDQQQNLLLPTAYFLVTFTLPAELRALARRNQRTIYNLLFRASSQALLKLAQDPRFVGGRLGMVGVLQTWTRDLRYHPHIHYIVTGGGLSDDGHWRPSGEDFLVHEKPLAIIFRAKLRDELKKCGLFAPVDQRLWKKKWVVDCEPVGNGAAAFKYLATYIFRVALSNNRLSQLQNGNVTFAYKDSATDQLKRCTLSAEEFIRRFLQHVLPPRFIKVRYFGLLSPSNRHLLHKARQLLSPSTAANLKPENCEAPKTSAPRPGLTCPHCRGPLTWLGPLAPRGRAP
jgi:Putative transposase/Transposase zinc-binding domain